MIIGWVYFVISLGVKSEDSEGGPTTNKEVFIGLASRGAVIRVNFIGFKCTV